MIQQAKAVCPCCNGTGVQDIAAHRVEFDTGAVEHRGVRVLCPTCKGIGAVTIQVEVEPKRTSIGVN